MFDLLQKLRAETGGGAKFTLANAATLMAVLKNPGLLQNDLLQDVGGIKDSAMSRQIDVLEARARSEEQPASPLIKRVQNPRYRRSNDIWPTERGEQFARELADYFNQMLDQTQK
jgi:DNA-binding MarR family transcriptional regulator